MKYTSMSRSIPLTLKITPFGTSPKRIDGQNSYSEMRIFLHRSLILSSSLLFFYYFYLSLSCLLHSSESGIMFPICIKQDLPLDHLIIRSVAVRGYLGPMTVWISKPENTNPTEDYQYWDEDQWTRVYSKVHEPSRKTYQSLVFDRPVTLKGGEVRILYIHSTAPHDRAVVYDNSYFPTVERARYEDAFLKILSGKAHLSPTVFGQTPIWGWGSAWRPHREFVGQLEYGIVYQLWSPERHLSFGRNFQEAAHTIFGCQRRFESPVAVSLLPPQKASSTSFVHCLCVYLILRFFIPLSPTTVKAITR